MLQTPLTATVSADRGTVSADFVCAVKRMMSTSQSAVRSGGAVTQEDAEKLAQALRNAGVVLVHRNTVFLRPEEAAVSVLQVTPGRH